MALDSRFSCGIGRMSSSRISERAGQQDERKRIIFGWILQVDVSLIKTFCPSTQLTHRTV